MAEISGYRKLTDQDIDNINRVKDAERSVGDLWRELSQLEGVDKRWAALAKTKFQEAFMALNRAVVKPEDVF
jgi:hypothetical protein